MMSLFTGQIDRLVYQDGGSGNTNPSAIATATTTATATPASVTFDASASSDADGDPLLYAWDFESDGTIDATGAVVSHTYTSVGRSSATLIVSDGNGGSDSRVIEIDVLATQPQDGNLALGRPATQSPSDGAAIASRAVDGNTDGTFAVDSVAQTQTTRTPLWEVDLGDVFEIGSLQIHTRSDGVNPLSNYWILISETPLSSGNLDAAQATRVFGCTTTWGAPARWRPSRWERLAVTCESRWPESTTSWRSPKSKFCRHDQVTGPFIECTVVLALVLSKAVLALVLSKVVLVLG